MKICRIMPVALTFLLVHIPGARGRNVPVYREYTQPIAFYDETGQRTSLTGGAPDLLALQTLRDTQAQAGLMGKETLFDLMLTGGGSVFAVNPAVPLQAPVPADETHTWRKSDDSARNWLAGSLKLPSLGQTGTNAAESVLASGNQDSRWGWLADEVAERTGPQVLLPEQMQPEEELAARGMNAMTVADLFAAERGEAEVGNPTGVPPETPAAAGNDRDHLVRPGESSQASSLDQQGGGWLDPARLPGPASANRAADMSETRKIISEISAGVRPDFASLRDTLVNVPAGPAGTPNSGRVMPAKAPSLVFPESANLSRPVLSGSDSGRAGAPATVISSWRSGWLSSDKTVARESRWGILSDPVSAPVMPSLPAGGTRPSPSGGGYKPVWQ